MNGRTPRLLLAGLAAAAALLLVLLLLPGLIAALPGQVRGRLPEAVLRAVTTPLPTALPPPLATRAAPPVSLAGLLATPTEPPLPSPTAVPRATRRAQTAVSPTAAAPPTAALTPPPAATPTPTAVPLPPQTRISGLSVVPQQFNNCGPASLSVVLGYYGAPDTQTDIAAVLKPHYDDRNVSPGELAAYVRAHTALDAAVYVGGDVALLRRLLAAGFPVLVEKGYEPNEWQGWMGHYLTLTGYDDAAEHFIALDTFLGPWDSSGRPLPYEELLAYWGHFNNTFVVVYRRPEREEITALLGPAYVDPRRMWQNAAAAAAGAQPQDAFAWFNLGAGLTELARLDDDPALYEAAAAAFDEARLIGLPPRMLWYQFQPYEAYLGSGRAEEVLALATAVLEGGGGWHVEETHYYQALAHLAAGEHGRARAALRNALQIRPGYPEAQALLDALPSG